MLARAGLGCLSLWWLQRRSSRITSGEWPALIEQLCRQVGLSRPVDLLTSPWRTMPMTWGLWRTRLLLPEDAFAWTAQQRRMVLLHELAHARRWDSLTQWIAQLACALHWFNPLAWLAWRCMQTERERACDDLVLASGTLPSAYAEQLLHIAADTPVGRCSVAGIAMARPSKLEGRLLAILNDRCCRRSLTRRAIALLVVAFAAILLPIGMMRAVAVDSAVPGGPVPKTVATTTTAPQTASAPSSENTVEHARDCSRDFSVDLGGDLTLEMVWVPKGTFEMGSPPSEEGRRDNEGPLHTVHLEGFWLGKYEVTQEQYERVMGRNHALFKGPRHPVETMSWEEAVSFCDKLPKRVRQRFTLPSEAQWEYACRAGSRTRFCFGDSDTDLADYAWYVDNAQNSTRPVGQKRPNAFGLYDMHGNVFELCADDWHDDYNGAPSDGSPWLGEDRSRTGRGGCWAWPATISRSAFRDHASFINKDRRCGFRVAALPFAAAQAPADYTISGKVVDQTPDYSRLDFDKLATCKTDEELVPISRGNTITGVNIVMDRVGGDPR